MTLGEETSAGAAATVAGHVRMIKVNGTALGFVERGKGEPVVAVHGALSDLRVWGALGSVLSGSRRFIAYTQRYFGGGPQSDDWRDFSRETHVSDLIAFIEALATGPVHVVGWSYGGETALYAALRRPDLFRTMVLYDPSVGVLLGDAPGDAACQKAFIAALQPAAAALGKGDEIGAAFRFIEAVTGLPEGRAEQEAAPFPEMFRENSGTLAPMLSMAGAAPVTREELERLAVPVRIVVGERSHERYRLIADRLANCLGDAEFRVMRGAHHDGPYRNACEFAAMIEAFHRNRRREAAMC